VLVEVPLALTNNRFFHRRKQLFANANARRQGCQQNLDAELNTTADKDAAREITGEVIEEIPTTKDAGDNYEDRGVFEVRGFQKGEAILWRDYSKEERVRMGEILDPRYCLSLLHSWKYINGGTPRIDGDALGVHLRRPSHSSPERR